MWVGLRSGSQELCENQGLQRATAAPPVLPGTLLPLERHERRPIARPVNTLTGLPGSNGAFTTILD